MKDIEINVNTQAAGKFIKEYPVCSLFLAAEVLFTAAGVVAFHDAIEILVLLGILCWAAAVTVGISIHT
jgi:hypothetical protein